MGNRKHGTAAATERLFTAAFGQLLAAHGAFGFALACFLLLPKFLALELEASPAEIGWTGAAFGIAIVAVVPAVSLLSRRLSRRTLIVASLVLLAVSSLGFVVVERVGVALLVLRALQGAAYAVAFASLAAVATELAPTARLSEALGLVGATMLAMNAVAPAIVEPVAMSVGWSPVFVLAAVTALFAAALAWGVDGRTPDRANEPAARLTTLLGQRRTIHYALVTASTGVAFGAMFTFVPTFALELGRAEIGGFFIAYAVSTILVRVTLGSLPDRLGRGRVSVFALNLYTLVVLVAAGGRADLFEVVGVLLGVAHGLFFPAFNGIVLADAPSKERATLLAIFTGAFNGGLAAGVFLLGIVADLFGYPPVFALAALVTFAGATLLVFSPDLGEIAEPEETLAEIDRLAG